MKDSSQRELLQGGVSARTEASSTKPSNAKYQEEHTRDFASHKDSISIADIKVSLFAGPSHPEAPRKAGTVPRRMFGIYQPFGATFLLLSRALPTDAPKTHVALKMQAHVCNRRSSGTNNSCVESTCTANATDSRVYAWCCLRISYHYAGQIESNSGA